MNSEDILLKARREGSGLILMPRKLPMTVLVTLAIGAFGLGAQIWSMQSQLKRSESEIAGLKRAVHCLAVEGRDCTMHLLSKEATSWQKNRSRLTKAGSF